MRKEKGSLCHAHILGLPRFKSVVMTSVLAPALAPAPVEGATHQEDEEEALEEEVAPSVQEVVEEVGGKGAMSEEHEEEDAALEQTEPLPRR